MAAGPRRQLADVAVRASCAAGARGGAVRPRTGRRHHRIPSPFCTRSRPRPYRPGTPRLDRSARRRCPRDVTGHCRSAVQSSRALEIERAAIRACGDDPPTRDSLARLLRPSSFDAGLPGVELPRSRASPNARSREAEGHDTALARLRRERGVGPWTVGVIAVQGLGRYDAGLVSDLGLVKLLASLRGRWPEPEETADLLDPYGEWQGLASVFLLQGFKRGLIPGASMDRARAAGVARVTPPGPQPYTHAHGGRAKGRDPRRGSNRRVAHLRTALVAGASPLRSRQPADAPSASRSSASGTVSMRRSRTTTQLRARLSWSSA